MPQTALKLKNTVKSSVKKSVKTLKKVATITKLPTFRKKKVYRLSESDLINAESALGATLFGPIPAGHRREFFRYRHNIWVFHESWHEGEKKLESTITYEVKESGVYKCPLGDEYKKIKGAELENFRRATHEYLKLVKSKLY